MLPRILIAAASLSLLGTRAEPLRYRIEVKSEQQMDMSAMGQGNMNIAISSTAWVAITSRDSAGTTLLHVIIDSAVIDAGELAAQMPPEMLNIAKGTAIDLAIVAGKMQVPNPEAIGTSPGMSLIVAGVNMLYPNARTGVKLGDAWVDTTTSDTTSAMGKGKTSQIRKWKASSTDGDALVLDIEFTGTMTMDGAMASIAATSSGTSQYTMPPKGAARKASNETKSDMKMMIAAAGSEVHAIGTTKINVVPLP